MNMDALSQLKQLSKVVADTGDFEAIKAYQPVDATTNPSLLLKAAQLPTYRPLIEETVNWSRQQAGDSQSQLDACVEKLSVAIGCEILQHIPGRVSTEVSARHSYDKDAIIASAHRIIGHYDAAGIPGNRVLIKTAATWQGIEAARVLEAENIQCNMTLLFGFAQALACAEAGVYLISPFVGRILDWYKKETGRSYYPPEEDPGVQSVARIFNYYKEHQYKTIVMGASFRNTEQLIALAGCDQLTISPALLEELSSSETKVEIKLDAKAPLICGEKYDIDESEFLWQMNQDAMATEKLTEGIRGFYKDEQTLKAFLADV